MKFRAFLPGLIRQVSLPCLFLLLCCFGSATHADEPLRMVTGDNGVAKYAKGLLKIILSKLPDKFSWDETTEQGTEERMVSLIEGGQLDLVWYASTQEYEERMRPIRIPIFRGLLGYRVLMIKEGTQSKFDNIHTLEDLKKISLGQGRFWADTDVLTANNLKVVKVTQYNNLFYMLDGDRFDAFPRGAHEPWAEIERQPELALTVEKNLLISYTNMFYFFVNKNNKALADKLERGFRIAIEDGSFDAYFRNDKAVQDVISKANLRNRRVIHLTNPNLPPLTPVNDKSLWLDPLTM